MISTPVAHDVASNEFVEIFSRYGRVAHAVILATIDNASRRRGFIVMSTNGEARTALGSLSRTEIRCVFSSSVHQRGLIKYPFRRGHVIDVSWAVVQRSQGQLVTSTCCFLGVLT